MSEIERQGRTWDSRRVSLFNQLLKSASRTLQENKRGCQSPLELKELSGLILSELEQFVGDLKLRAFNEVFILSALAHYTVSCTSGHHNIEIHRTNVYVSVLSSTLRVRLGSPSFLSECYFLARPNFLVNSAQREALQELWNSCRPDADRLTERKVCNVLENSSSGPIYREGMFGVKG